MNKRMPQSAGEVALLNVGDGDTKLSFDPKNPAERIRAARIVADMLKRGYALLIQLPDGSFTRCLEFRENVCEYVIADFDPVTAAEHDAQEEQDVDHKAKRAKALRRDSLRKLRRERAAAPARSPASPQPAPALSQWHQRPAAERALLERLDGHAHLRNKLREVARRRGEWAGIPMPLSGERLVIEPRYPFAVLGEIGAEAENDAEPGWKVRNTFWSTWRRCVVVIFEEADGRITRSYLPGVHSLEKQLHTLGCAEAWGIEQESKAVQTLGTLVAHRQFKQYMLTGSFVETSKRTGLVYMFRRLRPTAVIEQDFKRNTTSVRCTLCLHPIGYYENSWAGAMCPTDDVIAHLMMMRGDEPMFWRKANQHPPHRPESGL